MKLHPLPISAAGEKRHKSRSPAMRDACDACDACDAFICSGLRYLAHRVTVFPDAGIAQKFLPSEIPSKSFTWGSEAKNTASTNRDFS